MQRTTKLGLLAGTLVFVATLTGCAANTSTPAPAASDSTSSAATTTVDMTDPAAVAALCGNRAGDGSADVALASFNDLVASTDSGRRNATFETWGVNPKDEKAVTAAGDALKARVATPCTDVAAGTETVGVENSDGTVGNLPFVAEGKDTTVIDTTSNPATPPLIQPNLLDRSLRYTAQTLSWAGLVERVGTQQWYIDGVNARAPQTGFTWDDVLKFASVNKIVDGKVAGVNALAIQVFNRPDLDNEAGRTQVRDEVRKYITPDVEKTIGITVDDLAVQFINNGFVNTWNAGTFRFPKMGNYFDAEKMIRVSLMPITFDANGRPVGLDGSRGSGVFIDCGNLHWVPVAVWKCTDATCAKPVCPPGTTGTPPNCPPIPCPPTTCLTSKDWPKSPNNSWTPLQAGPLTTGHLSLDQLASGETRANVTDHSVPAGTKSGDVTSDLPTGTIVAPGATPGGDSQSAAPHDSANTSSDVGGTSGATNIGGPPSDGGSGG